MAIALGSKAPDFKLKDKNGKVHSLSTTKAKHIVLYFYPKDDTSGCTLEAKGFNKQLAEFKKIGATVLGISGGDSKSKANFCKKYGLNLPLLSDSNFAVSKQWKSYGTKSFMGRKYTGILRKTFVIDSALRIVKIFDTVKPETHSSEVLKFLKTAVAAKSVSTTKTAKKATAKKAPAKTAASKNSPTKKSPAKKIAKKAQAKLPIAKPLARPAVKVTKSKSEKSAAKPTARSASSRKLVATKTKRTTAKRIATRR